MVRRVLAFARGMDGRRIEVEPANLIADVEKIVRDTFPKNIRVVTRVADDVRAVQGDPTQLHQVLVNLCVNARDAMPDGGRLALAADTVELESPSALGDLEGPAGPFVRLEVEDSGSGIAPSDLDKIFDPFFTTKEVGRGTGLGLSTSLAIVKSHGGFVRVYSEPGRGTRFQVFLPAESAEHRPSAASEPALLPRGNGETVLVVDDEASIRLVTRQTLEAFGYRVLLASDGAEALALYAQKRDEIDVVLSDMLMPILDGAATINALLRIDPEVRIIAASGLAGEGVPSYGAVANVREFLPKPYNAEALLKALRRALGSG
jgi:CheY-like chemotaxis protein